MKFISAQPAIDYYAWQVEVYIHNFLSINVLPQDIHVLGAYDDVIPHSWKSLEEAFPQVGFFFYKDTRTEKGYIPSIQPHILKKHFAVNKYLETEPIFYHDCDFIFTRPFDFTPFLSDDNWYFSDTVAYIGAEYIKSKGEEVFLKMCSLADIDPLLVESNQRHSGGAQKLIKNATHQYWHQVEVDANNIYLGLGELKNKRNNGDPYGVQIWCASMWSELWNAWKRGHNVVVPPEFDFAWATCPSSRWETVNFFHNAGVPGGEKTMFHKGSYRTKLPYGQGLEVDKGRCSYYYYDWIKRVENKTCLKKH
tara:strand:+ start:8138 stop:9061 length:924 start_codon:yes stop_codon:yes gene_type:complete